MLQLTVADDVQSCTIIPEGIQSFISYIFFVNSSTGSCDNFTHLSVVLPSIDSKLLKKLKLVMFKLFRLWISKYSVISLMEFNFCSSDTFIALILLNLSLKKEVNALHYTVGSFSRR